MSEHDPFIRRGGRKMQIHGWTAEAKHTSAVYFKLKLTHGEEGIEVSRSCATMSKAI